MPTTSPLSRRRLIGTALTGAAGATLAAAAPFGLARGQAPKGVYFPETFTLPNGLQGVVVVNKRAPVVLHMVWYRCGAADEPAGKSGIAHFLEHLMFKGTPSVPGGQFSRIVSSNGGQQNALTSYDYTAYYQTVARDRLDTVMKIEADRMSNLAIPEAEVAPERLVIIEERRQRTENSPRSILWEQMQTALFQHHPYRIPIIGWEHEMRGLTREDAMAFYRRHYHPDNAMLIVAGDTSLAEVRRLAEAHYGGAKRGDVPLRARVEEPPHRHPRRVIYRDSRVDQPAITRAYLAPSFNRGETRHAHALQVLAEIVGGGSTSRLYQALVVKQKIATSAGAAYSGTSYDLGQFYAYGSPLPAVDLARVEAAIDAEIAAFLADGPTKDETDRAKQRLGDQAVFVRESLRNSAYSFGIAYCTGRAVADVEAWPERIEAVTEADILAAARHVLRDTASVTGLLMPETKKN
jgi:zinc protease